MKSAISATVDLSSTRMVADRHRLAANHNKHCWRAFRRYQHRWPWTTLNPKNRGFKWFFLLFYAATHTLSEFSLKCTGDRRRQSAYEIKLMLWRVSWALAQISCSVLHPNSTAKKVPKFPGNGQISTKVHGISFAAGVPPQTPLLAKVTLLKLLLTFLTSCLCACTACS